MKPHLPATLRRALLAALAIATLTPSARADLTLGSDDTLIIDYATDSTLPPADADGVLTLNGDTKLQLNNCGTGDGKTYTIITGVSGLVDKDGNALTLTDYAASVYFDTTQPGTGFWAAGTLQLEGNELQLVLHSESVNGDETFTSRQVNPSPYNYYKSLLFDSCSGSKGGAIYGDTNASITLSNNGSVSFSGNQARSGGAIYGYSSTITLSNNGSVSFSGNKASAHGGAIFGDTNASTTLSNNGCISFTDNTASAHGGAIGAIYGGVNASITLSNNGSVSFSGNKAVFDGGAIYGDTNVSITLSNNGSISFTDNTASDRGGAIFGYASITLSNTSITLSNNGSISFSGNQAESGGAIYTDNSLSIRNNKTVEFRSNVEGANNTYRLRSIYQTGDTATSHLSAPAEGSITFYDSVYIKGNLELNAAFNHDDDATTPVLAQTGTITFDGSTAEADLNAYFEKNDIQDEQGNIRKATQDEIIASRTSTLEGSTTLHAGTLKVVGGAILEVKNSLTVKEGAKLIMTGGGTLNNAGTMTLNGETVLDSAISNSGTLTLSGTINVQTGQYLQADAEYILYSETLGDAGSLTGNGFASDQSIYTIIKNIYTIIKKNGTPTINDSATWTVDGAAAVFSQTDTAGTLTVTSTQNTSIYWVNNGKVKISEAADNFVTDTANGSLTESIAMNGGSLVMDEALNGVKIRRDKTSTIEIADGVDLSANEMTGTADVTLAGKGSYSMESAAETLDAGVKLGEAWSGTVYTGSITSGMDLNVNAMGNAHSTVYLGARPMRRAGGSETVLEKLTASDVGTTTVPGSLTLQKGESTAQNLNVQGALTLGTADSSASLNATGTVTLQGLRFGHAESSMQAQTLTGVTTLDVQMSDAALSAAALGKTYTLVTLDNAFDGDVLLNGQDATEGLRSADNRRDFTLNWNTDGTILTLTILGTESYVTEQVQPTTHNGRAGVALMTDVFLNDKPAAGGALEAILQAVDAGTATDRDMAAVAGASTATLGMAMAGDVERQLRAIRNRSVSDAWGQDSVALDGKGGSLTQPGKFFAWVNAEGNRSEQEADGTAAGYTLNSWGGTVGAGMQMNHELTLGIALTAMYGDLKSDGPDTLDGDMDTTYLSAFSRYSSGAWSHALIGTVGSMEADYKRHAVGYATKGDTDGTAFGLMYELSHRFEMNEKSSISPVFNIAYRHTKVDSYSESGSDAALSVGEQSLDTVTVGAGARYAAVVGEQSLNRPCNVEARALLKYDFGDTQSDTCVGFIEHATRANIESADLGAFGVELGAGISVPVGDGRIFADGAVELRSGYTNYNATIGYGIRF